MFTLKLELATVDFSGLCALEQARRLGLHDTSRLSANHSAVGRTVPECEVDERFARLWFSASQTICVAHVPLDLLSQGDVRLLENGYGITFAADLPAERIRELYVAVRFRACREQVARLEEEKEAILHAVCRDAEDE